MLLVYCLQTNSYKSCKILTYAHFKAHLAIFLLLFEEGAQTPVTHP